MLIKIDDDTIMQAVVYIEDAYKVGFIFLFLIR